MPVLTLLKLGLLGLLYLFLARTVRAILVDVYGPSRRRAASPPPRPAVATPAPPRKPRKMPREIVVHAPGDRPQIVPLNDSPITLGRSDHVSVQVRDDYVSDEHAAVVPDNGGWAVRDLGSTNGTFLNGAKVTQPTPLSAGDQVRIGKTRVEVRR